jgi:nucleoside-triphosphatase THEP1
MVLHVFVAAQAGTGKTTCLKSVCEELKKQGLACNGFFTEEVRNSKQAPLHSYDIVTCAGERGILARDPQTGGQETRINCFASELRFVFLQG